MISIGTKTMLLKPRANIQNLLGFTNGFFKKIQIILSPHAQRTRGFKSSLLYGPLQFLKNALLENKNLLLQPKVLFYALNTSSCQFNLSTRHKRKFGILFAH